MRAAELPPAPPPVSELERKVMEEEKQMLALIKQEKREASSMCSAAE